MTVPISFSMEVAEARAAGAPIVALESTIITHGMPYPDNLKTAQAVESDVRAEGATPATIAVLDGQLHVGLSAEELEALAQSSGALKLSRADLPFAMASGQTGSTTVAATMIGAHLAGIEVFATGGIGGVHRGAELSFDVSADLIELAQTPVVVVAAGAKAILDVPKTLEFLETQGVPVVTYGSAEFPAFWSRASGIASPLSADRLEDVAGSVRMRAELGLPGGHLLCNPVPQADEIPAQNLAPIISQSLREADEQGIQGKAVTPFLLQRIFELTNGASLTTNIALVRNNARVAARLAAILARTPPHEG